MSKDKNGKSPFEKHTGTRLNTVTNIFVKQYKKVNDLENGRTVDDCTIDDSTIFVGTGKECESDRVLSRREKGKSRETVRTLRFVPTNKTSEVTLSRRTRGKKE